MAAPINLEMVDAPILEQTSFEPDMKKWLSNLVDIINASFTTISNTFGSLIAVGQIDIGGGAGPTVVSVTGINSGNFVNVTLVSSTLPVKIINVTPGSNQFSVTFSGNPGASAIIAYQVFISQPT